VQRLKTRAQFEAAMAGGTAARTTHFVLHRAALSASAPAGRPPVGQGDTGTLTPAPALFPITDDPWIGAVVPKRWAKRAVTRNGIKRQIYSVSASFASRLPAAAHVVRLRMDFARAEFPSAWSEPLKKAVRGELLQLFEKAAA
jgi:ribonuclease P protein component